eukprot:TRINITY_DN11276_c0_g1_i1.p1 TRINITY_DN11276_c0_g1~~TRINITY_DN11276_c0_g1_i1.p1  ORF type:complete len:708 (+),score=161.25 TRINITY_DN11276_c0_g1_i1:82-2205(+)
MTMNGYAGAAGIDDSVSVAEYKRQLATLQEIRSIAEGIELNLPQICVVGDQSSGKSSLLAGITDINFPVSSGICTKAPIVVECQCDKSVSKDVYEIEKDGRYKEVAKPEDLAEQIKGLQNEELLAKGVKISTKEIRVRVRGPTQINIIVIDLPGIIHSGEGQTEVKELISAYIKKEQTLVLLVSEAKQDDEGCCAIDMARASDQSSERTLRVFTKCDMWDSQASKKNFKERMNDSAVDLKLSPHAVVCCLHGEGKYDSKGEEDVLTKELSRISVPRDRYGVSALKERLPLIYANLIRTNLPTLEQNIEEKLKETREKLSEIGEERKDSQALLFECQNVLLTALEQDLRASISEHFRTFQEAIHATETNMTQRWSDSKFVEDLFACPFFQGNSALQACMKDVVGWWRPLMEEYVNEVEYATRGHIRDIFVQHAPWIPEALLIAIDRCWEVECTVIFTDLKKIFLNRLLKEAPWGTVNHYLTSVFKGEEALPEDLIEMASAMCAEKSQTRSIFMTDKAQIQQVLQEAKERWSAQFQKKSLHQQQQLRLFHAVKACWTVEHKTFTDYILKETREQLLEPHHRWILSIRSNTNILEAASEAPSIEKYRQDLKDKLGRLSGCKRRLSIMKDDCVGSSWSKRARREKFSGSPAASGAGKGTEKAKKALTVEEEDAEMEEEEEELQEEELEEEEEEEQSQAVSNKAENAKSTQH